VTRLWLVGQTGRSLLDVWSIAHFAFWVFIGSVLWSTKAPRVLAMVGCLVLAFAWEEFERMAEERWPSVWLNPESWANAYVSDIAMCVFGLMFMWWALDNLRV